MRFPTAERCSFDTEMQAVHRPSRSTEHIAQYDDRAIRSDSARNPGQMTDAESVDESAGAPDPGMVRAGAAAAARRRELDISQRSLAAGGIINAGALIAFEKGRSWPRQRTRAKLEEVLRWPPGAIDRLRRGESVQPHQPTSAAPGDDEASLIAQAVITTVSTLRSTVADLPSADDAAFTPRVSAVLAKASAGSGKKRVDPSKLGGIFGIELAGEDETMELEEPTKKAQGSKRRTSKRQGG